MYPRGAHNLAPHGNASRIRTSSQTMIMPTQKSVDGADVNGACANVINCQSAARTLDPARASATLMVMRALFAIACGSMLGALVSCSGHSRVAEPSKVAATSPERERELTAEEWARLRAGERVERPHAFLAGRSDYIGGMSHQLVDAEPDQVLLALLDPNRLQQMLPQTHRIVQVGSGYPAPGLELEQGNDLIRATYSVVLDHDLPAREVRFRLDRSRPSDIDDVEGFFRVAPAGEGQSLITVAAALDVGSTLVRLLFADIIQSLILATPSQIKGVVEASAEGEAPRQLAHANR